MQRFLPANDSVRICHKDNCIHVKGDNTKLITFGAFTMLVLIGFSALARSN